MRARSLAQASMESHWIAGIYESRLWRRNAILGLLQGISFEREFALVEQSLAVPGAVSRWKCLHAGGIWLVMSATRGVEG